MSKKKAIIEYTGVKFHYENDMLHRTDGPAVEYIDGDGQWYYNDQLINYKKMPVSMFVSYVMWKYSKER